MHPRNRNRVVVSPRCTRAAIQDAIDLGHEGPPHNRKNWLHLGSDRGGHTAATHLSLVQSCKNLGNEPFAYLRDVLARVSTHPASRIDDLLPDRRVLPEPAGDRKA
jgi:IS66 C-terminal element